MTNPFHTLPLFNKLPVMDRLAWLLASVTMPNNIHEPSHNAVYRREHTRLWNIELHGQASRIRGAMDDLMRTTA